MISEISQLDRLKMILTLLFDIVTFFKVSEFSTSLFELTTVAQALNNRYLIILIIVCLAYNGTSYSYSAPASY